MPKKRPDYVIFDEPLIDISMEPTEEVDPLFIDPTADVTAGPVTEGTEDDVLLNGLSIFSPKVGIKKGFTPIKDKEEIKIKKEVESEQVKVKEEPKDPDDDFDLDLPKEEETDPAEALAQVLDKVEFLCPRCTFRSTDKEEVTQHFVTSHRIFQVGIPRPCDKCDFIAKTVRELAAHKKASHPRSYILDNLPTLPTGEFKCPHCDFMSFHKNNVRSHMKVHTQDTVYTCDKCPYTAISRLNIENHAARHLIKSRRKWKFKCKHCGLLERTEKLLQRHLILHGEGEMVKCQLCSYKSPYNHIISMHTRICHGIVSKRTWEKEEKWKMRVRKSTRQCAKKRYSYPDDIDDDFQEEFLELPAKRTNRGRKKKICDTKKELDEETVKTDMEDKPQVDDEKSQETTNASQDVKKTEEVTEIPRRPTLEERLGRARELINKNLSRKKRKPSPRSSEEPCKNDKDTDKNESQKKDKEGTEESEEDNHSTHSGSEEENDSEDNSENALEDEDSESKEDWSEEESEFCPESADESTQSFASDKAALESTNNALLRDTENSMTGSESLSRAGSIDDKSERQVKRRTSTSSKRKRKKNKSEDELTDEELYKKNKLDHSEDTKLDHETNSLNEPDEHLQPPINQVSENPSDPSENLNDEQQDESVRLVLKRNGSSFTCVKKNNTDSL